MAHRPPTAAEAYEKFAHLENLIQQLDDGDLDEAIALIGTLLDREFRPGEDGPVRLLVPVAPRPTRPVRALDD